MTTPLRIGGVTLAVRDLPRVEAFYRDIIGLQRLGAAEGHVQLGAGGVALVDLVAQPGALPDDPAAAGLFHTAFLLPSRADLANWLAHMQRLAFPLEGASNHLVSEALYLSDPEGNGIEVYADQPSETWEWTGSRLRIETARLDIPGLLAAQTAPGWVGAPAGTRVGHVHLRVGDVAQAAAFYGDVVGLDVTASIPSAVFMSSGRYHHHIAGNTWRSAGAGLRNPAMAGLAAVTFEAADSDVLAAVTARAGQGAKDPWGTDLRFRVAG